MAEPLNLTIKVNTETGQLEVLGAKFRRWATSPNR
jgi:hypothetical protein